jgi:hypothetical protein
VDDPRRAPLRGDGNRRLSVVLGKGHTHHPPVAFRRRMSKAQSRLTRLKPVSYRPPHLSDDNQPAYRRDRDCLSSTNRIQFFQNNLHLAFHRVLTYVKDLPDFFIALADAHVLENLKLALRPPQVFCFRGVGQNDYSRPRPSRHQLGNNFLEGKRSHSPHNPLGSPLRTSHSGAAIRRAGPWSRTSKLAASRLSRVFMNETVKAIRFYKTGRSDVLSVDRIQLSQLKENEVLVRVLAVAVSRLDLLWRQGASIDSLLDWMNMRPRIATWRQMIRLVRLRKK